MACIVPDHEEPHSHPILPPMKTPVAIEGVYRKCIKMQASLVVQSALLIMMKCKLFRDEYRDVNLGPHSSTKHEANLGHRTFTICANTSK